jgi:periplasmic protein TonB
MSRTFAGLGWMGPAALAVSVHLAVSLVPVRFGGAEDSAPPPVRLAIEPPPPAVEAPPEPVFEPPPEPPPETIPPPRPIQPPPQLAEPTPAPEPAVELPPELGLDGALISDMPRPRELPPIEHVLAAPPPPAPPAAEVDLSGYRDGLHRALSDARRYPMIARRLGLEGEAQVRIVVRGDGSLGAAPELLRSTGHDVLDEEVLRLAKAVAPYPPLPAGYPDGEAEFLIPIVFALGN